jgi:hypothetical protein
MAPVFPQINIVVKPVNTLVEKMKKGFHPALEIAKS